MAARGQAVAIGVAQRVLDRGRRGLLEFRSAQIAKMVGVQFGGIVVNQAVEPLVDDVLVMLSGVVTIILRRVGDMTELALSADINGTGALGWRLLPAMANET